MSVEFNEQEIKELMKELSKKRPIFDSEDDFKFSLAWLIKEKYRDDVEIRLEKKMNNNKDASSSEVGDKKNKNQRIDIFIIVKNDKEKIGIELKYFTAKIEWQDNKNEETFILAEQAANDIKCYDAWKDVERLEDFINRYLINRGFVIWLTNINSLTKDPTETKKRNNNTTYHDEFKIFSGREINGPKILEWDKKASQGTIKGRKNRIIVKGNYKVCWKVYEDLSNGEKNIDGKRSKNEESKMVFKYAVLEVQ